jgi:glycosyltransferase involved in cell wall biosynthesis
MGKITDMTSAPNADGTEAVSGPIAYLTGEYPRVSHTFIQREVAALRAQGLEILTCSIRRTDPGEQTGEEERDAARTTFYVLAHARNPLRLIAAHFGALAREPHRYLATLRLALGSSGPGARALLYQLFYFAEAVVLAAHLRRVGARHIHNHFADQSCTVAMLTSAISGIPFSFTTHGPTEFYNVDKYCLGEKVSRAAFVICISHFCRSQLMLFSTPVHWSKLKIIHCGVDLDRYGGQAHASSAGRRVLFIGRLAAVKGVPVLVEAFRAVRDAFPDATLTLVGDGADRQMLEERVRELGLGDTVTFTGYLSQSAVAERLADAEVLALPSFAEGVPIVLMEAMASRKPVVATRIAGVSELVEDGISGFLTPAGDAGSLSERLVQLLGDRDLRQRMGRAGRAKVEAEFDLRREAVRIVDEFYK